MEKIVIKELCTGCTACMNICPKQAISFVEGQDGFKYPLIDQEKCIDCGLCKKTCPVLNTKENEAINECYVGYHKDSNERLNASSGSIFSLVANYILDDNGIVVGAAFDDNNHLRHIAIQRKEELNPLRKSKYLQSDLDSIFTYIKDQLKNRKVLFVGTPCQVAGIKSFIKNNDNLFTIDLICHGAPSPKLFEKYIKELEEKNNDKLVNYDFRDKCTGWDTYSNTVKFQNNSITELAKDNKYMKLFLSDVALRESCYNCIFKLGNKYSDITLGDFWGVEKYYPEMYNEKGVSAIIINTQNGKEIFDNIKNNLEYKKCSIEEIVNGNPSIQKSGTKPLNRVDFFEDIDKLSVDELAKKYIKKENKFIKILKKCISMIKN